ncbi:MAG: hypothetical protein ACPGVB_04040 [Chitinophagales bacterium]
MSSITPNITSHLSIAWKEKHADLFVTEHWNNFINQFNRYLKEKPTEFRLPYFNKEVTPPINQIMTYFKSAYHTIIQEEKCPQNAWAKVLQNAPFEYLLIVLGQRLTPASITDERAIPPLRQNLVESCAETYNGEICVGTRAWEKHVGRSEKTSPQPPSKGEFWGEIKGTPAEREQYVKNLVLQLIDNKTWWNVFFHYKHELVYEIRIESGHGIRWNKGGTSIIGFLEPFINE